MSAHIALHPHAGASIEAVSAHAQRIADLLGVTVEFIFNDVMCMAAPGGDANLLAERQQVEQRRPAQRPARIRFASSAHQARPTTNTVEAV